MTAELSYKHNDDRRPIVNQYLRGHRVGKGQHGEVWVCWDLQDNRRELVSSQRFFMFEIPFEYDLNLPPPSSGHKGRQTQ
jgi:hypothetical protein